MICELLAGTLVVFATISPPEPGHLRIALTVPSDHGRSIGFLHVLATGEGRDARFTCAAVAKRLALDPAEVADVVLDGQRHCVIEDVESSEVLP